MSLHIDKDRTNNIDLIQNIDDILSNTIFYGFEINEIYKNLESQINEVKPFVMKVDYSSSM
jgi:hypothetical protein